MYRWIVFFHVAAGFLFALAHGTSLMVAFQLRRERELLRLRALLDLSGASINLMYAALGILLVAGIAAGFVGKWWGRGWIWAALILLFLITGAMYARGTNYYRRVREATGPDQPASPGELDRLLKSGRPFELAAIGYGGLLMILWLMMFKPF